MPKTEDLIPSTSEPFRSILIFGPPGSGKGTLGKSLSTTGNHFHLSAGDMFRGLSPESSAGKLFHTYASRGHLLPDEIAIHLWRHYVGGLIATNRYFPHEQFLLLDGVPRTLGQAQIMDKYIQVMHIIVLEIEDVPKLIKRMQRRAVIEKRQDDTDELVLRTRMEVYEKDTSRLLQHYPQELVSRFNAGQKPLEVLRDVLSSLTSLLTSSK